MARPVHGGASAELTAGGTISINAGTRAIWIPFFGGSNTTFTHAAATVSLGGLAATLHESRSQVQVHMCGYYIEDISGRSNNVLSVSGVSLGTGVNQYRFRVHLIDHPTNKVLLAAEGGNNALGNGGTLTTALAQGAGVESLVLVAANAQALSGALAATTGMASPVGIYSGVGGPAGTSHTKRSDRSDETGSTTPGHTFGSGSNTQRSMLATAWKEGVPLVIPPTPPRGRIFTFG